MTEPARNITDLYPGNQSSSQNTDEKPWFRQQNEPAVAFLHFRIYLDLGPRRSLRKAVAIDRGIDVGDEGLRDIKIPGSWIRASKVWDWKERAAAYDLNNLNEHSKLFKKIATCLPYCSKYYRVCQLHSMAAVLEQQLLRSDLAINTFIALTARLQSVMRDMAAELSGLDLESRYADEVGLCEMIKSNRLHVDGVSLIDMAKDSHVRMEKL